MGVIRDRYKVIFCMVIAYLGLIAGILKGMPLHTSTDELGAIASAALVAGRDWTGVIDGSGYYGFGYYVLFFWIFKITDSPILIYQTIVLTTAFLRVLIIPISYYIGKHYLKINSNEILLLSSLLMPLLYSSNLGVISNEFILEVLIWIIILLCCKAIQYQTTRRGLFYLFAVSFTCFYSLLIHTRALTIVIAITIILVAYGILNKNFHLIFGSIMGGFIAYFLSKKIVFLYQMQLYGSAGGDLRNSTVELSTNFHLFDLTTWDVWLHMILGLIDTEIILTGGIFAVSIVAFFFYIHNTIINKGHKTNVYCNVIFGVSILCIGATVFAFLFSSWFEGMLSTWKIENAGYEYAYKGLTYIRYWDIYVPPFVLCVISIINQLNIKRILSVSAIFIIFLHCYFYRNIIPLIHGNGSAASFFHGLSGYNAGDSIDANYYFKCIVISMSAFLLMYFFNRLEKRKIIFVIMIVFLASSQIKKTFLYDLDIKERMSSKIMASYEKKEELDKKGIEISNLFLYDDSKGNDENWKIYSIAQFYFNSYKTSKELPEKLGENDVIISTGKAAEIEKKYKGICCYELDDNEVWYTYLMLEGER